MWWTCVGLYNSRLSAPHAVPVLWLLPSRINHFSPDLHSIDILYIFYEFFVSSHVCFFFAAQQQKSGHLQMLLHQHVPPDFQSNTCFLDRGPVDYMAISQLLKASAAESLSLKILTQRFAARKRHMTYRQFLARVGAAAIIRQFNQ